MGIKIENSSSIKSKKIWLYISVIINLGLLGIFKYYNFFISSFYSSFNLIGVHLNVQYLEIILPVGISFYTFHGLSYVFDIYRNKIKSEHNYIDYALFVSFFPLLVAGPVERATHLLPQLKSKRLFSYNQSVDGLRQILWGLFKKMVIADSCAILANQCFLNPSQFQGYTLLLGAVFFSFQIYGDFSGYSDIAIGVAKLFGIELLNNFSYPYFSKNIAEFWRRWHISLSSWFKDYVYIPLGGSKISRFKSVRNIFIVFLLSGLWHGAHWNFVLWGLVHSILFLPLFLLNQNRIHVDIITKEKFSTYVKEFFQVLSTFILVTLTWIIFRATSITNLKSYLYYIYSGVKENPKEVFTAAFWNPYFTTISLLLLFITIEWFGRKNKFAIHLHENQILYKYRWFLYLGIFILIFIYGNFEKSEFIYFAF